MFPLNDQATAYLTQAVFGTAVVVGLYTCYWGVRLTGRGARAAGRGFLAWLRPPASATFRAIAELLVPDPAVGWNTATPGYASRGYKLAGADGRVRDSSLTICYDRRRAGRDGTAEIRLGAQAVDPILSRGEIKRLRRLTAAAIAELGRILAARAVPTPNAPGRPGADLVRDDASPQYHVYAITRTPADVGPVDAVFARLVARVRVVGGESVDSVNAALAKGDPALACGTTVTYAWTDASPTAIAERFSGVVARGTVTKTA